MCNAVWNDGLTGPQCVTYMHNCQMSVSYPSFVLQFIGIDMKKCFLRDIDIKKCFFAGYRHEEVRSIDYSNS